MGKCEACGKKFKEPKEERYHLTSCDTLKSLAKFVFLLKNSTNKPTTEGRGE